WGLNVKKPDVNVIIAHGIASVLALRLKKKYGINYVNYIHHPLSFLYGKPIHESEERDILGPLSIYPFKLIWSRPRLVQDDLKSIKEAHYNFTNSQRILKFMFKIYGKVKAEVCYPAIEDTFHNVLPKSEFKEDYVLYASRHVMQKGFHLLPEILSKLRNDAHLVIAGRPTELTNIILNKFRKLCLQDKVILKPNLSKPELLDFYKRAKVLLFPAFREDFGLSPIEGMATGAIPVVWQDGGGVEETVQDFKTGLFAKPYDISDYASKVDLLLEDKKLYTSILHSAKEYSRTFSWDKHVEKILKVI
ncbi:MAG: glycosyltransferase family 4 protein, partial [Fervidicoccus fontis]